jgi:SAM-dependent methyltransferase
MGNTWDQRYSVKEYVYGETPNVFFKNQLAKLSPGRILLPCEGEGRNGVYAATLGWSVEAFDGSELGKTKAIKLADSQNVNINYIIADASTILYPENSFDIVALIYAHFPALIRRQIHQKAMLWLKPGGRIILEAFNPDQLQNTSGGPKELSMLYTADMLKADFEGLSTDILATLQIDLNEGKYHDGIADVIRYVGIKTGA